MTAMQFGRLQRITRLDGVDNDVTTFVAWLKQSDNSDVLNDILHRDLSVVDDSDEFSADIHCRDTTGDVYISVLFNNSSDGALGKLLTAAAACAEHATLVFIASEITARHRMTLDWLNRNSRPNIQVFGVELVFWQINDSRLAPEFKVVCEPLAHDQGKYDVAKGDSQTGSKTEEVVIGQDMTAEQARQYQKHDVLFPMSVVASRDEAFPAVASDGLVSPFQGFSTPSTQFVASPGYWNQLMKVLNGRGMAFAPPESVDTNWVYFPLDEADAHVVLTVSPHDYLIAIGFVLTGKHAKARFNALYKNKDVIEAEVEAQLQWRRLPDKEESNIFLRRYGVDPNNPGQWQEQHEWFCDQLEAFSKAIGYRVADAV